MNAPNRGSVHKIGKILYIILTKYQSPGGLNYAWNYGVLGLLALGIQVVTGIVLAMFYTAHIDYAFYSVEHIMRDINLGYILRYTHATGASFFFIVIYAHILRGIWYGSYHFPRSPLWFTGILIFFLMIITAFLGYLLPWGQMSFWGGTVITNLVTILPYGESIVEFLWGGFSVGNPTLNKFFALHFLLPFILIVVVAAHLFFLHSAGSNNPLGIAGYPDKVSFAPYYIWKDLYFAILFCIALFFVTFFAPNLLTDPDNYVEANPLVTPPHIVPEWYFLPYYAILRGIPNKTWGVLALLSSIVLIGLLPILHKARIRILDFKTLLYLITVWWSLTFLLLFILGAAPIAEPWISVAGASINCFFIIFAGLSVIDVFESKIKNFWFTTRLSMEERRRIKQTNPWKNFQAAAKTVKADFGMSLFIGAVTSGIICIAIGIARFMAPKPKEPYRHPLFLNEPVVTHKIEPVHRIAAKELLRNYGVAPAIREWPYWYTKAVITETAKDVAMPTNSRHALFSYVEEEPSITQESARAVNVCGLLKSYATTENFYATMPNATRNVKNKELITPQDIQAYGRRAYKNLDAHQKELVIKARCFYANSTPDTNYTRTSSFYKNKSTTLREMLFLYPPCLPEKLPEKIYLRAKKDIREWAAALTPVNENINFFRVWASVPNVTRVRLFCKAVSTELELYLKEAAPTYDFGPFARWRVSLEYCNFHYTSPVPMNFLLAPDEKLTKIKDLYTHLVLRHEVLTQICIGNKKKRETAELLYYNLFCLYEKGLEDQTLRDDLLEFTITKDPTLSVSEADETIGLMFCTFTNTRSTPVLSKETLLLWKRNGRLEDLINIYNDPEVEYGGPRALKYKVNVYNTKTEGELQDFFEEGLYGNDPTTKPRSVPAQALLFNKIHMSEDTYDFNYGMLSEACNPDPTRSAAAWDYLEDFNTKLHNKLDIPV